MLSVRPKIAELAFRVYGRRLHPELYTTVQSRRIERSEYEARVDITSCGHVVTWESRGVTICEVATSATEPLPEKRCLISSPLKGSRTDRAECYGGITYRTHYQLDAVSPDMFFMVAQQLAGDGTTGLLHRFESSGRMAFGAISYANIETRQKSLLIQAIHTFPDDYAILKVESLYSLPITP